MRAPAPVPDPTLTGRLFRLLRAVMQNGTASTDDALLVGELHGRRQGNPKLLGIAVAEAHRRRGPSPRMDSAATGTRGIRQTCTAVGADIPRRRCRDALAEDCHDRRGVRTNQAATDHPATETRPVRRL